MTVILKKGAQVRQIVKPIEGEIKRMDFDPETGVISYIIGWTDDEGDHEISLPSTSVEAVVA